MTDIDNGDTPHTTTPERSVRGPRSYALNEDWLATIVGLTIVTLILVGAITPDWLPL